jgi:di/tricarboxylate transporter
MLGLELTQSTEAFLAMGILLGMFALFIRETYPVEVTAIGGAALMLLLGILPIPTAVEVLANPAPWTIVLMFLIMGGLVRTGAIDLIIKLAEDHVTQRPKLTIVVLFVFVAVASAVMNNTPLVAVMIPLVVQIAKRLGLSPSKMLIPLSYMTVMGGMMTLIGTSTNLLVDGVARKSGLEGFSIFEALPLGLAVAVVGGIFLALFSKHLLPDRQSMGALLGDRKKMKYFTEVAIPEGSPLIEQAVLQVSDFSRSGVRVIDVLRGDSSLRRNLAGVQLMAGDRVVLRTEMAEVLGFQENKDLRSIDKLSSVQTETVEVLITPGCKMIGRSIGQMRVRRRYGVYVLAAHRRNKNITSLESLTIEVGDTLLLEGSMADITRFADDMELVDVSTPSHKAFRRHKAWIAVGALAFVVVLAAFDVAPIMALGFVAVAIILLTKCIDSDEAFTFIDGRLLAMIFAMLAVGEGLDHSGAVSLIVAAVKPLIENFSPFFMILAVYLIGLILTEFLSNNAVAVIYTPIAIQLAQEMHLNPRPFVVAVMFSATLAFATPIGYQTNMMVYGPGGYKFSDYLRVGLPLNIIIWLLCSALIPLIWPLS